MKFYKYSDERKTKLTKAIILLENLIESRAKKEFEYQKYFEENQIVFNILGYKKAIPFTKSNKKSLPKDVHTGLTPEPDFIVEKKNGLFEIFEIKTPTSKDLLISSNKYRERFSAEIISYIKQTIIYENYFSKNPQNRINVKEKFGLDIQNDLDIKIIVGLDEYIDKKKIHSECRIYNYKIDIITYDGILNLLQSDYSENYGIYEGVKGVAIHHVLKLNWQNIPRNQFIFDLGENTKKNRISLFMTPNQELCYRIISEDGKSFDIKVSMKDDVIFNNSLIILCEYGIIKDSGFIMLLSINGLETEKKISSINTDYTYNTNEICLGASIEQKDCGAFKWAYTLTHDETLDYKKKQGIYNALSNYYGL